MKLIMLKVWTNLYHFFSLCLLLVLLFSSCTSSSSKIRRIESFNKNWKFHLGNFTNGHKIDLNDSQWRVLDLPHDWSIEGEFNQDNPATPGGGALPGGIGWYRKSFTVPEADSQKLIFVDFDGVYRNSEVWLNGHYLGKRPYGYSSFRYELTPFLNYGNKKNIIAVRVDNSQQPNSRWYSGSGIYRNVWLVTSEKIQVDHWGTFVSAPEVSRESARISVQTKVRNATNQDQPITLKTIIYNAVGKKIADAVSDSLIPQNRIFEITQQIVVKNPTLWSLENPYLYKAVSQVVTSGKLRDDYETTFGIRFFAFDSAKGFSLNGNSTKILGVCNHHDLGCLGAAVNTRALERQLDILKAMGCNAIRTSHNPPAPELLNLCDQLGFIVMDEAFDMWAKKKTEFDYALDWSAWHQRDLQDLILRDRNHPSVFIWSIGNEVMEQWDEPGDSGGIVITRELAGLVKKLDTTRPITAACNGTEPSNPIFKADALDLIGFNYHLQNYADFPNTYPGKQLIATETTSALETRGHYDMPSDSIRRWPHRWDQSFRDGNPENTCSAYDNCSTPWGSTHEESWKIVKKHDFVSGMFIWTGFDYLGEPTPYDWPSRSSYFGIVDLAGFPKDAYYMYQSQWTGQPVLHVFPHWNWKASDTVDVWAYTNCDEVELLLNGKSLGVKKMKGDDLHLVWRLAFVPGTLTAIGRTNGRVVLTKEIKTAGAPAKIKLEADRTTLAAGGRDLAFVTVRVLDHNDVFAPLADNLINFEIQGQGIIVGVDNGCQTSHEPFKANYRRAFNGLCLVVIQTTGNAGNITLSATSNGLQEATINLSSKKSSAKF
jgi:beta-galactosidase